MVAELSRPRPAPPVHERERQIDIDELIAHNEALERRLRQGEERRRAMLHIMADLSDTNRRLSDQRRAMLHILADYESDRKRLARQTERLDNSRRALIHILQDSHQQNQRLAASRKAMIHIMDDLRETTEEIQRREHELRDKQEQLVQAGKLATLGELTTGVAHELNNPLNNIGLFIGNAADRLRLDPEQREPTLRDLEQAARQVRKASEIISHLRTFGRASQVTHEPVPVAEVVINALSLIQEQFRLRQISVVLDLHRDELLVSGSAIQLEQVLINLLTNARDALHHAQRKEIRIAAHPAGEQARITVEDTGTGISTEIEERIFDPFFTTKEVGQGTGLGLSIVYGIIQEHGGTITVDNIAGAGARFTVNLPLRRGETS